MQTCLHSENSQCDISENMRNEPKLAKIWVVDKGAAIKERGAPRRLCGSSRGIPPNPLAAGIKWMFQISGALGVIAGMQAKHCGREVEEERWKCRTT